MSFFKRIFNVNFLNNLRYKLYVNTYGYFFIMKRNITKTLSHNKTKKICMLYEDDQNLINNSFINSQMIKNINIDNMNNLDIDKNVDENLYNIISNIRLRKFEKACSIISNVEENKLCNDLIIQFIKKEVLLSLEFINESKYISNKLKANSKIIDILNHINHSNINSHESLNDDNNLDYSLETLLLIDLKITDLYYNFFVTEDFEKTILSFINYYREINYIIKNKYKYINQSNLHSYFIIVQNKCLFYLSKTYLCTNQKITGFCVLEIAFNLLRKNMTNIAIADNKDSSFINIYTELYIHNLIDSYLYIKCINDNPYINLKFFKNVFKNINEAIDLINKKNNYIYCNDYFKLLYEISNTRFTIFEKKDIDNNNIIFHNLKKLINDNIPKTNINKTNEIIVSNNDNILFDSEFIESFDNIDEVYVRKILKERLLAYALSYITLSLKRNLINYYFKMFVVSNINDSILLQEKTRNIIFDSKKEEDFKEINNKYNYNQLKSIKNLAYITYYINDHQTNNSVNDYNFASYVLLNLINHNNHKVAVTLMEKLSNISVRFYNNYPHYYKVSDKHKNIDNNQFFSENNSKEIKKIDNNDKSSNIINKKDNKQIEAKIPLNFHVYNLSYLNLFKAFSEANNKNIKYAYNQFIDNCYYYFNIQGKERTHKNVQHLFGKELIDFIHSFMAFNNCEKLLDDYKFYDYKRVFKNKANYNINKNNNKNKKKIKNQ